VAKYWKEMKLVYIQRFYPTAYSLDVAGADVAGVVEEEAGFIDAPRPGKANPLGFVPDSQKGWSIYFSSHTN
jgi:hypothetical protein